MMSSTLLEQTRSNHEEVERLERLVVEELGKTEPTSRMERLVQGHRVRHMIDSIMLNVEKLVETYEDKDGTREAEIATLGDTSLFYDRLQEIREYHRKPQYPSRRLIDDDGEDYIALEKKEEPIIAFSGEEGVGRFLDLHDLYNEYINSEFGEKVDYSTYLGVFSQPDKIQPKLEFPIQYKEYMEALLEYLIYFFQRTEPLQDLDRILSEVETSFEEQNYGQDNNEVILPQKHSGIGLDYYTTVEEQMDLGSEKLKEALGSSGLNLKVGGTMQQRADRLFLTKHTPLEKLDKNHFAKQEPKSGGGKEIALTEAKVKQLCDLLDETIQRTKRNVKKKQGSTYEEMEKERDMDQEAHAKSESDDKAGRVYNPQKLPMGWDGKPIPHWLKNLHGLGQEFKCEICGDRSYKGRMALEMHFKEPQHQRGMRLLGIPNTNNFDEITLIDEAQELWKWILKRQRESIWMPNLGEEYEDGEDNIYNKKAFSGLQRQALI